MGWKQTRTIKISEYISWDTRAPDIFLDECKDHIPGWDMYGKGENTCGVCRGSEIGSFCSKCKQPVYKDSTGATKNFYHYIGRGGTCDPNSAKTAKPKGYTTCEDCGGSGQSEDYFAEPGQPCDVCKGSGLRMTHVKVESDDWECVCGNIPSSYGFYPSTSKGRLVMEDSDKWDGIHYKCDKCGRYFDQNTGEIKGQNSDYKYGRVAGVNKRELDIPTSPHFDAVMSKLHTKGHKALIVGGAVRDALLGEKPKDIDVEVYGTSYDELSHTLRQHGKVNLVGKAFGVVKFTDPDKNEYDFSLPRRDNKTGVGHKDFETEFDPDITPHEAASRRDFTFNSLAYDPISKELHDYHGGEEDLKNKVIRHTSSQFAEDPLRVLRGMQFSARYGMDVHPETAELAKSISHEYSTLPKERVGEEFMKLATKGKEPGRAIDYLHKTGWGENFPALHGLHGLAQDPEWHPEGDVAAHTAHAMNAAAKIADREGLKGDDRAVTVFGAMLHDVGKATHTQTDGPRITSHGHDSAGGPIAKGFLNDIGIKPDITGKVVPLVENHMQHLNYEDGISHRTIRRLAERLHPASVKELSYVMEADHSGRPPLPGGLPSGAQKMLDKAAESNVTEHKQERLIEGRDVMPYFNNEPGPHIGEHVKAAYEAQLNGEINTKEEGQAWLKKRLGKTAAKARTLYRGMAVRNLKDINLADPGEFWTADRNYAESFLPREGHEGKGVILEGKFSPESLPCEDCDELGINHDGQDHPFAAPDLSSDEGAYRFLSVDESKIHTIHYQDRKGAWLKKRLGKTATDITFNEMVDSVLKPSDNKGSKHHHLPEEMESYEKADTHIPLLVHMSWDHDLSDERALELAGELDQDTWALAREHRNLHGDLGKTKIAMPRDENFLNSLQYHYIESDELEDHGSFEARDKDNNILGYLDYGRDNFHSGLIINEIGVHPDHRHKGLASHLYNLAQDHLQADIAHSGDRTDQGDEWAKMVGGDLPKRYDAESSGRIEDFDPYKSEDKWWESKPPSKRHERVASWKDVRNKAVRLRNANFVDITRLDDDVITADVQGDHGTYQVELYRQFPGSWAITMWNCSCRWGDFAFVRQHTYVGRMCSHALATLYQAHGTEYSKPSLVASLPPELTALSEHRKDCDKCGITDLCSEGDRLEQAAQEAAAAKLFGEIEKKGHLPDDEDEHHDVTRTDRWMTKKPIPPDRVKRIAMPRDDAFINSLKFEHEVHEDEGTFSHYLTARNSEGWNVGSILWNTPKPGHCARCSHPDDWHDELGCSDRDIGAKCQCDDEGGYMDYPYVADLNVNPPNQRKGLATELWNRAQKIQPDLDHDDDEQVTDEGHEWIDSLEKDASSREEPSQLSHEEFSAIVRKRRDRYIQEGKAATPWDINSGFCEEFAMDVIHDAGGYNKDLYEDEHSSHADVDSLDFPHIFIHHKGRYYDAENVNGVDKYLDLPYFNPKGNPRTAASKGKMTLWHIAMPWDEDSIRKNGLQGRTYLTTDPAAVPFEGHIWKVQVPSDVELHDDPDNDGNGWDDRPWKYVEQGIGPENIELVGHTDELKHPMTEDAKGKLYSKTASPKGKMTFYGAGRPITIDVEVSRDATSITQGLMNRQYLAPRAGMAFVYPHPPSFSAFWMSQTFIPLSIAFWDKEGRIIQIMDMDPCPPGTSHCPVYKCSRPYWGAVEVNQGFFKAWNIKAGDRIELNI